MALLSPQDTMNIAHLARLAIEENDIAAYTQDLSNILNLANQMNTVDTTHISTMTHPLKVHQRLRNDAITEPNQREAFQAIAPQVESGLYLVPQVIE